jgi:hypothetical protein
MSKRNQLRALTVGAPKKFRSELVELIVEPGEMPRPPREAVRVRDPETGVLREPRLPPEPGADVDAALAPVVIDLDEGKERIVVEVRQLTQAQTATVRRAATVNGKLDEDKAVLHLIIASCFEPAMDADGKPATGGTTPLYDAADIQGLEAQPANAPWLSALARACGNVAGLSGADLGKG